MQLTKFSQGNWNSSFSRSNKNYASHSHNSSLTAYPTMLPLHYSSYALEDWCEFHLCVYAQLSCTQIPKAQKAVWPDLSFFRFWDKSCSKNVVEFDTRGQFHQQIGPMQNVIRNGMFCLANICADISIFGFVNFEPVTVLWGLPPNIGQWWACKIVSEPNTDVVQQKSFKIFPMQNLIIIQCW